MNFLRTLFDGSLMAEIKDFMGISKSDTSTIVFSDYSMEKPPQKKRRVTVIPLPEQAYMEQPSQHRRRRRRFSLPNFGNGNEFSTRHVKNWTMASAVRYHTPGQVLRPPAKRGNFNAGLLKYEKSTKLTMRRNTL
ncbi:uncharacterized protein LOC108165462 [Drosophila miranda]|uniref:uncharacterized protein LOC108165462 n=1 Tax=Drosophila miranda TaxID=7229 RepID=UPI0007E85224|nr:uncharacterized protein LOC108165462 [Drosophila miranda]